MPEAVERVSLFPSPPFKPEREYPPTDFETRRTSASPRRAPTMAMRLATSIARVAPALRTPTVVIRSTAAAARRPPRLHGRVSQRCSTRSLAVRKAHSIPSSIVWRTGSTVLPSTMSPRASSGVSNCTAVTPSLCNNSTPGQSGLTGGLPGYLVSIGYDLATGWGSLDVANFIDGARTVGAPTTTTLSGCRPAPSPARNPLVSLPRLLTQPRQTCRREPHSSCKQSNYKDPLRLQYLTTVSTVSYTNLQQTDRITATCPARAAFEGSICSAVLLKIDQEETAIFGVFKVLFIIHRVPARLRWTDGNIFRERINVRAYSSHHPERRQCSPPDVQRSGVESVDGDLRESASRAEFLCCHLSRRQHLPCDFSAPLTISVAALTTTTTLSGPYFTPSGSSISLSATVSGVLDVPGGEYTPNVQFYNGKSLIGSVAPAIALSSTSTTTATATLSTTLPAGSYTITAFWPGDLYTSSSTSTVLPVVSSAAGITVTPTTRQVTLPAPGATGLDTLTISSFGGTSGNANSACAVTYSGSLTISAAPTCSLSNPTVTLTAESTATSVLTLSTVGAQTVADLNDDAPGQGPLVLCVVGFISTLIRRRRFASSEHRRACLLALAAGACWLTLGCNK